MQEFNSLIIRLMADYFNVDDFTIKQLGYSASQHAYLIETDEKKMVLRILQTRHAAYYNSFALRLLSGKGVAPELIMADEAMSAEGIFFSFEEFLPGKLFPYKEEEKRAKILPAIVGTYKKVMDTPLPKEAVTIFQKKTYMRRIYRKYFEQVGMVFAQIAGSLEIREFAKKTFPQKPERLCLALGRLGFKNTLFDEGNVHFFDMTRAFIAEPEMDWGYFFPPKEQLQSACEALGLDLKKVYYYALLHQMKKCVYTRNGKRQQEYLASAKQIHQDLLQWTS